MQLLKTLLLLALLAAASAKTQAWSDHASLVWPLLRTLPALQEETVPAETLEQFVAAQATGLERLLAEHEATWRDAGPPYAPRPDALSFRADAPDLRRAFLEAIRVNPLLAYRPYRQRTVEDPPATSTLAWDALSFLAVGSSHTAVRYQTLAPGERVAPAHVLASASDEPDFGLDIGLFEDNGTEFGARYGFGTQPFGNPNLDYGSQAPFHMGFYHLDWLTRTAQPDLLRTYPEWRVSLFGELARYAFASGHDYWGWRFSGWALHYIGDLTQPYHAQPLPGIGTLEALWLVAQGRTAEAVQLVSNRHGVLESYQHQRVQAALNAGAWEDPVLRAIAGREAAATFDDGTLRSGLTVESVDAGDALDAALERFVPARFVSDPAFEWTGSGEERGIVDTIRAEAGEEAIDGLDAILIEQMRRFSRYTRAWIEVMLARSQGGPGV